MKSKWLTAFAVCSLLVAVVLFLPAPATACNAVGGGGAVPAFSFTQPVLGGYGGGYGTQQFVQADTAYGGCGAGALTAPVYAQQFVSPLQLGLNAVGIGYGGYGGLGYGLGFRQPFIGPRRFVVAPRVVVGRQRVVVAGY